MWQDVQGALSSSRPRRHNRAIRADGNNHNSSNAAAGLFLASLGFAIFLAVVIWVALGGALEGDFVTNEIIMIGGGLLGVIMIYLPGHRLNEKEYHQQQLPPKLDS
jgi:hypothetical protein